jgi:hypothetical protein
LDDIIGLKGFAVDHVARTERATPNASSQVDNLLSCHTLDAILCTLLGGLVYGRDHGATARAQSCFKAFWSSTHELGFPVAALLEDPNIRPSRSEHYIQRDMASEFARESFRKCRHRSLFTTDSGKLGLGPKVVLQSDRLVILYGFRMPMILRPVGGEYLLVGPCYVHGIMRGEAVASHRASGKEDQIFWLR